MASGCTHQEALGREGFLTFLVLLTAPSLCDVTTQMHTGLDLQLTLENGLATSYECHNPFKLSMKANYCESTGCLHIQVCHF